MREIIPFKKDILFKTRINEITDISLEHDYKIMDNMIEGEFILSGTYKMTEASVINEDFFYQIPFMVAINENVKKESIDLTIKDFTYEIENSDILKTNISLLLNYEVEEEREEEIIEKTDEEEVMDIIEEVENEEEKVTEEDDREEKDDDEEENNIIEELDIKRDKEIIAKIDKESDKLEEKEIDEVVSSVKEKNDYVTYKVYMAKEEDSFESISIKYDIDESLLRSYNKEEINAGDKIIIPFVFNDK